MPDNPELVYEDSLMAIWKTETHYVIRLVGQAFSVWGWSATSLEQVLARPQSMQSLTSFVCDLATHYFSGEDWATLINRAYGLGILRGSKAL
jgi:spore maturation protein SpmB